MVRQSKLFFLWAMLYEFRVNTAFYLAKEFKKVARASKGAIMIGGLITPIIMTLGIHIVGLGHPTGNTRLDID